MPIDYKVEIHGVRELNSALKKVDAELPKELRVRFLGIANEVIGVAQQKMPYQTGEAANSIKPRASQKGAGIAFPAGGGVYKAAYYPWLDFGGAVGRKKSSVRPFIKTGRFIYPAIEESKGDIEEAALDAVEAMADAASLDTRGV